MELENIKCGMVVYLSGSDRKLCVNSKSEDGSVLCNWHSNDGSAQSSWYKAAMLNVTPETRTCGFKHDTNSI